MQVKLFLTVTALSEALVGLSLLIVPEAPLHLLFGLESAVPETTVISRICGAALISIGIASWRARVDQRTPAQMGLLAAILVYDVSAAVLLALAATLWNMAGMLVWPGALLHAALAGWCCALLAKSVR